MNEQFLVEDIYERELNLAEEYERENIAECLNVRIFDRSHKPHYGAINN